MIGDHEHLWVKRVGRDSRFRDVCRDCGTPRPPRSGWQPVAWNVIAWLVVVLIVVAFHRGCS